MASTDISNDIPLSGLITPSPTTSSNGTTSSSAAHKKDLTKDDFLKLLTTQLQNQDPLKPMENTDFMAQMAQLTSLEQSNNMLTTMQSMLTQNSDSNKIQALALLGTTVNAAPSSAPAPITGPVTAVKFVNGAAVFTVSGYDISLSDITGVPDPNQASKVNASKH
ncbi:MAG: flagellar biosynthesis protein FlgD [Candidatus Riflebacteria bacterium]|nr:flagellar biosynthesis protein FlgD [Candidatus Riflebacteria bacterium]